MIVFRDGLKKTNFPGEGLHCIELPTLGFQKADVPTIIISGINDAGIDMVISVPEKSV